MAKEYTEDSVQTLDALTHIRMRSGMYIGRLGDGSHADDGIYILIKEVIDNSIDEFIMNHGKVIDVKVDSEKNIVSVRDYGRGIPLGKVIDCVSQINTGAKYNDDVFQFSVGLNGVGTKAVNALSEHFNVKSVRNKESMEATFSKGKLLQKKKGKSKEKNGTYVEFTPDREVFKKYAFNHDYILKRMWYYAYLNRGLTIKFNGQTIHSANGLLDLLNKEVSEAALYEAIHHSTKQLEFCFVHAQNFGENYFTFVNGQHTADGGVHLSAFREGLLKAINEFSKKNFQGVDVREGIVGAILVRVKEPIFESQTKNKLGNSELRAPLVQEIKQAVLEALYENPTKAKKILERVTFNEKLRKELASVKKEAKEKQKKISFKIPQLRDCKYHFNDGSVFGEQTMIFLTEGESASGSLVSARNPHTQAIFSLKGKPMNVFGLKMDQLYKNEEMYNIMSALNLEEDIANLRYNKVVLATDADVDGMHIRNLLITFFLTYFESLVVNGHLYVLETPLFKVRNKKETIYCYSEEERDAALEKLKKGTEITRFKGLGEISPKEFKRFIGEDMRIFPITIDSLSDVKPTLQFYMGKNTPERKRFIMQNLEDEKAQDIIEEEEVDAHE